MTPTDVICVDCMGKLTLNNDHTYRCPRCRTKGTWSIRPSGMVSLLRDKPLPKPAPEPKPERASR